MTIAPGAVGHLVGRRDEGPRGQLIDIEAPASLVATYTHPGQYCALAVDGAVGYFAIARPPGPGAFRFYVQRSGDGPAAALLRAPLGTPVSVGRPAGDGYPLGAALAHGGPLLALCAGSGWFGLSSALWALAAVGRTAEVYAGFRHPADVLASAEQQRLRDAGFTVHLCLSRPPPAWTGRSGHVQHALVEDAPPLADAWVIACGQPQMLAEATARCTALGLPAGRFLTNY